MSGSGNYTALN